MDDGSCNDCAAFAQEIQAIANKHLKSISKQTRCRCVKNRVILKRPKYTQMIIWHFECHQCDYSSFYASEIENHVDSEHPSFAEEPQSLPLHATVPLDSATSDSKESLLTESPSLTLSIAHLDSPEKTVDSRTPSPHSQAVQNTVILSSSNDSSLDVPPSAHSALVTQPAHSALVTSSAHSTLVTSSAHSTLVTSSAHSTLVTSSAHSTLVTSSATSAVVSSATSATESPTVVSSATPPGGTICELSQTTSSPMMPPSTSSSDSVCSPVTPPSISSVANKLKKPVIVNVISSPKTEATVSMITTTAAATKELPTTRTAADASLSETSVITTTGSVTITAPQAKAAVVNSTPQPAMLYVVDETAKTVGYPVNCPMANSEASHAQKRSKPKLLPHKQTKTKSKQIAKPATARNDVISESLPPSAQVLKQSSTSTSSSIKKKAQTEVSIACRPPATITPGDGSNLNSSPANTDTIKPSVLSPPGPEAKPLKSPTLNLNDFTHILGLRQLAPKDPISEPSVESPVIKNSMEGSQFSSRRVNKRKLNIRKEPNVSPAAKVSKLTPNSQQCKNVSATPVDTSIQSKLKYPCKSSAPTRSEDPATDTLAASKVSASKSKDSPILQFPHLACSNTLPTIPLYRVTTPQSSFIKSKNQADTDSTPLDPFEFAESSPTSNSRGMFAFKSTGGRKYKRIWKPTYRKERDRPSSSAVTRRTSATAATPLTQPLKPLSISTNFKSNAQALPSVRVVCSPAENEIDPWPFPMSPDNCPISAEPEVTPKVSINKPSTTSTVSTITSSDSICTPSVSSQPVTATPSSTPNNLYSTEKVICNERFSQYASTPLLTIGVPSPSVFNRQSPRQNVKRVSKETVCCALETFKLPALISPSPGNNFANVVNMEAGKVAHGLKYVDDKLCKFIQDNSRKIRPMKESDYELESDPVWPGPVFSDDEIIMSANSTDNSSSP